MYRHSPVRSQRSRGIKIKHVVQVCLLIAVCFWLIFQVKRSHDKKKEFNANNPKLSLTTHADEVVKFGRKELQPKLPGITEIREESQEQEDEDEQEENKHEEEEVDDDKIEEEKDDKIEEEKDDGGGGGDDEIDESEQEKSTVEIDGDEVEIDRNEVEIVDEDRETEESEDGLSEAENRVDHEEDGSAEHTNEAREEHYKADDASSAVITHDPDNQMKNGSTIQQKDSESTNATAAVEVVEPLQSDENGPPPNTTSVSTGYNATVAEVTQGLFNLTKNSEIPKLNETSAEENSVDPTHLEQNEVRNDLETSAAIETEGGHSENTAAE